jgi:hypothetical protein
MIKKLFILGTILTGLSAQAQFEKLKVGKHTIANRISLPNQVTSAADTLRPASLDPASGSACGLQLGGSTIYQFDVTNPIDTGWIFGTNQQALTLGGTTYTIQLSESAQKYNVTGSATITDILFGAAVAYSGGSTTMITGKIYSESATTKGPSTTVLGTTSGKALNTVTTTGLNALTFSTPVNFSNQNFFASVVSPPFANGDSLAIISTVFGCSSTDSLSWTREIATAPGGTQILNKWYSTKHLFAPNGNLDLWQFPVLTITTGMSHVSRGDLSLYAASPNPAVNTIDINFSLNNASSVQIDVFDVTGKLVKTIKNNDTFSTGKHAFTLNVTDLEAGSYMYSVQACGTRVVSKFVVTK